MENFIVSARKYRPTTFKSVVGQQVLTQTLRNAIKTNHLAHAYLFCGPRGVGKTTCARIFAKTINCQNQTADFEACNECESCRSFNEQRSFNIHELDAASNNSVEDIRSLIDQVRIPPQIGRYSVYIIDEVHMLSASAFNALLKTLEEQPAHAVFILATTEKHKVLPTILSRCQVYDFERITLADIVRHLQFVASQENVTAEDEALAVIAQKADGGMRDALSVFDQLVSFSSGHITYAQTIELLNVLDADYYFRVVDAFVGEDVAQCLLIFDEILQKGFEAQHFLSGLAEHLRNVVVSKDASTVSLLQTSDNLRKRYSEQAQQIGARMVFDALAVINETDVNFKTARNKRLAVELMLIRLCNINHTAQSAPQPLRPQTAPTPQPQRTAASATPVSSRPAAPATPTPPRPAAQVTPTPSRPETPASPATPRPASAMSIPRTISIMQIQQEVEEVQKTVPAATAQPASPIQQKQEPEPVPDPPTPEPEPQKESRPSQIPFALEAAHKLWLELSAKLHLDARQSSIISDAKLRVTAPGVLEVSLVNQMQSNELRQYSPEIVRIFREYFADSTITINYVVNVQQASDKAFTAEDRYKLLAAQNSKLADFTQQLGLLLE